MSREPGEKHKCGWLRLTRFIDYAWFTKECQSETYSDTLQTVRKAVESPLYGCMTWIPLETHYAQLRWAHHVLLYTAVLDGGNRTAPTMLYPISRHVGES